MGYINIFKTSKKDKRILKNAFFGIFVKSILLPFVKTVDEALNLFGLSPEQINDEAAIKKSYRTLSLQHHPDVSDDPDAEENFKAVQNALEILEKYFGSYDVDSGRFRSPARENKFQWKNDPVYKEMAEHAKELNPEDIYQTHTNVEDDEKIKKMRAEIERVKSGEGGVWEEYKGSKMVFKIDLRNGNLAQVNYGNSRSKNAYRDFLRQELGSQILNQFEEVQNLGQSIFDEKYDEYINSGMDKKEASRKAVMEARKELNEADMIPRVPEDQLQLYRQKRIRQIQYYIKNRLTELSANQRSEELFEQSEAPNAMIDILTPEQPSVEGGMNLFTQMKNLGIFKVMKKGPRKGKITIEPKTVESLTRNQNPNVAFGAGVGLLMRQYIDSSFNERYITRFHTDPFVKSTANGLAGLTTYNNVNVLSYPIDEDNLKKILEEPENVKYYAISHYKRDKDADPNILLNNAKRGIYMFTEAGSLDASEYKKSNYKNFTKQFIAESPEHEEYAQKVNAVFTNEPIIDKNMKYYALQFSKALIQSGKSDVNRHADFQIKWDEDDRDVYQKYNDFFSRNL